MSRTLKLLAAGLAAGSLLLMLHAELYAQGAAKKSTKSAKSAVRPAQGIADEVTAPRPKPRALPRSETPPAEPADSEEEALKARPTRPKAQPLRVEKLSPELEKILKDWETRSAQIQKLTGSFERYKYDHVFFVEYRASGKFAYEMPDRGAYEFEGSRIPEGKVSQKTDPDGKPYALKSDQVERWVCNGQEVLKIDDKTRTYEKVLIPAENQGENIIDGPLPFLFGMKAEAAKRRYAFELVNTSAEEIQLRVIPKLSKDSVNWREAKVIISAKTFLPIAVKLVDPSNNAETVHRFSDDLQVNGKAKSWIEFWKTDPFKPDLRKYQLVQNSKEAPSGTPPQAPGTIGRSPTKGAAGGATTKGRPTTSDRTDRELPRSVDASSGASKKKSAGVRN